MNPKRVYIDTSVVGGCLDPEFREPSLALFERFREGRMIAVLSDLTRLELSTAPSGVLAMLDALPSASREETTVPDEARDLADLYVSVGVIGAAHLSDARHIAAATLHHVDALASWNFKHIVNLRRIPGYQFVNRQYGYREIKIQTPAEVLSDEG